MNDQQAIDLTDDGPFDYNRRLTGHAGLPVHGHSHPNRRHNSDGSPSGRRSRRSSDASSRIGIDVCPDVVDMEAMGSEADEVVDYEFDITDFVLEARRLGQQRKLKRMQAKSSQKTVDMDDCKHVDESSMPQKGNASSRDVFKHFPGSTNPFGMETPSLSELDDGDTVANSRKSGRLFPGHDSQASRKINNFQDVEYIVDETAQPYKRRAVESKVGSDKPSKPVQTHTVVEIVDDSGDDDDDDITDIEHVGGSVVGDHARNTPATAALQNEKTIDIDQCEDDDANPSDNMIKAARETNGRDFEQNGAMRSVDVKQPAIDHASRHETHKQDVNEHLVETVGEYDSDDDIIIMDATEARVESSRLEEFSPSVRTGSQDTAKRKPPDCRDETGSNAAKIVLEQHVYQPTNAATIDLAQEDRSRQKSCNEGQQSHPETSDKQSASSSQSGTQRCNASQNNNVCGVKTKESGIQKAKKQDQSPNNTEENISEVNAHAETAFVILIDDSDDEIEEEEHPTSTTSEKSATKSCNDRGRERDDNDAWVQMGGTTRDENSTTRRTFRPNMKMRNRRCKSHFANVDSASAGSNKSFRERVPPFQQYSASARVSSGAGAPAQLPRRCEAKRAHNYNLSYEDACKLQEQLLAKAAARMRAQQQAQNRSSHYSNYGVGIPHVEIGQTKNAVDSNFVSPVQDIASRHPEHWKWSCVYARLGLPRGAHIKLVKSQYRRLALLYHTDKSRSESTAPKFQAVTEAYHTILEK